MKHLTWSLLGAGLVALAACHKNTPLTPASPQSAQTNTVSGSTKREKGPKIPKGWHLLTMHTGGDNAGWCDGQPTNCIYIETTITVKAKTVKNTLDNVAEKNSAEAVAQLFTGISELDEFTDVYIPEDYLAKLRSGSYYLKRMNDDGTRASYIAGTNPDLTLDNMEFAIQLNQY